MKCISSKISLNSFNGHYLNFGKIYFVVDAQLVKKFNLEDDN